ncbi:signal peptidase I [Patulibacter americanus]|uniref:signal peptidase I n=1 Tax=Patulibacter americanus TaxID=588672 RepID=UPI0003B5F933|nr:signal peptidase I [Patulibacter americanus]
MGLLRLAAHLLGAVVCGFGLVVLLAATVPSAFGDRTFVVRSGSMTPAIRTGDIVAVRGVPARAVRVGDIVTFDNRGKFTSHRVRSIEPRGNRLAFVTQGDANTGQEHWQVAANGTVGRVVDRVPMLGFAVVQVRSTAGQLGLIVLPALLLGLLVLRRIWRREPTPEAPDALAV